MNRRHACRVLAGAGALAATACGRGAGSGPDAPQALLVAGAAAMLPLVRALAADFTARGRRRPALLVEPGGSLPAYIAACRGAIDVAAMARALLDDEDDAGARHYLLARDAIGIAAHPALPLRGLTRGQVPALLTGAVANWSRLGGPDLPVTVCAPARGTAARPAAQQLLLGGAEFAVNAVECADHAALRAVLRRTPGAIGCFEGRAGAGFAPAGLLAVDGVAPGRATVLSGRYPYTQSFYLLLHGAPGGAREAFVRYARGAAGQAIVQRHGFIAIR